MIKGKQYWGGVLLASAMGVCAGGTHAQVVTPRERMATVYGDPTLDSQIVGQVEFDSPWQLSFTGAVIVAKMPEELPGLAFRYLLPARDTGFTVFTRIQGRNKRDRGWIEPDKVEFSLDRGWKTPQQTRLFVPMKGRDVPPLHEAAVPPDLKVRPVSYLLLISDTGHVKELRVFEGDANPPLEEALKKFRFSPVRFEGEPTHVLLAIRVEPRK